MTPLRRLLPVLVLCLLGAGPIASASAATTKYPSVEKVSPLKLGVGDTMTVRGKNYRSGTGRNTVVFKRDGGRAVFVKAGKATSTRISVKIPAKMLSALSRKSGKPVATRFRVRVLAGRFGRRYTGLKGSPSIGATRTAVSATTTADDCDGDRVANAKDTDDDNDLLLDTLEATLKTDACKRDSDGDGMSDGWEHESALDYNGRSRPAPSRRPYPNALDSKDGDIDADGDGLTNLVEYQAWATFGANKVDLNYSGGNPATVGKQRPAVGWHDRDANGFLSDNERDADGDGIPNQDESGVGPLPVLPNKTGFFAEEYVELPEVRKIVSVVPLYGPLDFVHKVQGTGWLDADSDGDSVGDGDDDQDGDGLGNIAELVTELGAGDKLHRHLNACEPNLDSRMCIVGDDDIDNDGIANRADDDDDGDRLSDGAERQYGLNPFKADTDGDAISDGYEFQSAIDLNVIDGKPTPVPFPGDRPYPNPLDGGDATEDFDGDGLTLTDEYRAWRFSGSPDPLNYSDGTLYTGGVGAPVADGDPRDTDGSGYLSDDERDVDGDLLTNWDEAHGRMTPEWWKLTFTSFATPNAAGGTDTVKESVYPGRSFLATSFVNRDTDGDGIWDGADDEDHDGFTNAFEVERPRDWERTYVSTEHPGGATPNPKARVNPFNPCKPFYSNTCHRYPPFDYYQGGEDWESPYRQDGP